MNEELISLDLIDGNPYQPREREDPEHVKKVALSIAEHSLLQIPIGRRVNGRIQLAFGHTRLAAFRWLEDVKPHSNLDGDWSQMPVILQDLTDQQLFEMAISENLARKDLSPIEEARAMLTYREKFGKKSAEIGNLFGLSDSAVRNKLRLLDLPEDVQAKVAEAGLTEGVARGLVTLFSLPENLRKAAEGNRYGSWNEKPSKITQQALAGEINAEQLQNHIGRILDNNSEELGKAEWPLDWEREHNDFAATNCKNCPLRIKERNRCTDPKCFETKSHVWKGDVLYQASQATGIAVPEEPAYSIYEFYGGWRTHSAQIIATRCENLRLHYDRDNYGEKDNFLAKEGFPNVRVYCCKKTGHCSCLIGLQAGASAAASSEDLQEAAREERARVRRIRKAQNEVREVAIVELVKALESQDAGAWRWMAGEIHYRLKDEKKLKDIIQGIAESLVGSTSNWTGDSYYQWLIGNFKKYGLTISPEMEVKDPD